MPFPRAERAEPGAALPFLLVSESLLSLFPFDVLGLEKYIKQKHDFSCARPGEKKGKIQSVRERESKERTKRKKSVCILCMRVSEGQRQAASNT
jgi:hypothetical protein